MCPTAVLVVGEVAHIVEPVLDVPVAPHEGRDLLGTGLPGAERGEPVGGLPAALALLDEMALALDAQRLPAPV